MCVVIKYGTAGGSKPSVTVPEPCPDLPGCLPSQGDCQGAPGCRRRPAGGAEAHAGRGTATWQGSGPPGGTDPPPPHTAALHSCTHPPGRDR